MTMNRRTLLQGIGGGLMAGQLAFLPRLAQASSGGKYQALVCIFMYGGVDGNNVIIPSPTNDAANYSIYQQWRQSVALPSGGGAPLNQLESTKFALHPALVKTSALWSGGELGVLFNVGTTIDPKLTVGEYQSNPAGTNVPANLFSHEDQKNEWKSAVYREGSTTGWGGRIADTLPASGGGNIAPLLSFAGPDLFTLGAVNAPLSLPASGPFVIDAYPTAKYAGAVNTATASLYDSAQSPYANAAIHAAQTITAAGAGASGLLNPVLSGTNDTIDPFFSSLTSSLSSQLWSVAKVIADQSQLGARTQVFYVDIGNFDTHHDELETMNTLLTEFDDAVHAFYGATAALGLAKNVTTFTMSDFNRTYVPNTTDGTDHAWGNHMFVIGGSVKPRSIVGTIPALYAPPGNAQKQVGPLDVGTEGRWIPQIAVDQYAATLAAWLGVSSTNIQKIFPNLAQFSPQNLGFLNPVA
jgi:uncharacterized protein (DUF1501 family)